LLAVPLLALLFFLSTSPGRAWLKAIDHDAAHDRSLLPGLTVEDTTPPGRGLIVTSLRSDSQAAIRGLAVGDDIIGINGQPVRTVTEAAGLIGHDNEPRFVIKVMHQHHAMFIPLDREGMHNGA
jgi:serine protease Do